MDTHSTSEKRIDLLRERRELRELILEDQERIDAQVHELHKLTGDPSPFDPSQSDPSLYLDRLTEIGKVCRRLKGSKTTLGQHTKRLNDIKREIGELEEE